MELPIFYREAEDWTSILLLYDSALKEINTKLEILNNEFKVAHQYNPIEHITSRIKSPESIAKKLRHNNKDITVENIVKYVNDVAGIRIICSFTSDIFRIAELLANQSDVKVLKVKDYITNPKENGYTSYHMIVTVPVFLSENVIETKVELQIRTIAMDFWASLEHKIYYKFEGNAPDRIKTELKECADIVSYLDKKMYSLNEEIKSYHVDAGLAEIETEVYSETIRTSTGMIIEDDCNDTIEVSDTIEIEQNIKKLIQNNQLLETNIIEENIIADTNEDSVEELTDKVYVEHQFVVEDSEIDITIKEKIEEIKEEGRKGLKKSEELGNKKERNKKGFSFGSKISASEVKI